MVAFAALLAIQAAGLDTKITIEEKDQLVKDVGKDIQTRTGVGISVPANFDNLKVTIFAKEAKAREVLDRISSVIGCKGIVDHGRYLIREDELRVQLPWYAWDEHRLRQAQARAKLDALSRLSLLADPPAAPQSAPPDDLVTELPEHWAARMIGQPAFRAAALWYRVNDQSFPVSIGDRAWLPFVEPWPLRVQAPATPVSRAGHRRPEVAIDEASASLRGTAIVVSYHQTTGEIRVTTLDGPEAKNDPYLKKAYRFATPPKELEKTPFAKLLKEWETPLDRFPKEMLERPALNGEESDGMAAPGYFDGKTGLSEELEAIYRRTGIPIVSTSFRLPALDDHLPESGTARELIEHLAKKEECFLRSDGGYLLVRHPAFWLFEVSEPPERTVRRIEAVRKSTPLGLLDYADLAASMANSQGGDFGWYIGDGIMFRHCDRWIEGRGILVRFDPKPIADAFPALAILGQMNSDQRRALLSRQVFHDPPSAAWKVWSAILDEAAARGPMYDALCTDRLISPATQLDLEYPAIFAADPLNPFLMSNRARFLWLTEASTGTWVFNLGFPPQATTMYTVTLRE
ncbi:MAG: hypothetical protein ACHQ50_09280 [Fimbriimonadales bacterium]